jgi:hypothetical protein
MLFVPIAETTTSGKSRDTAPYIARRPQALQERLLQQARAVHRTPPRRREV